MNSDRPESNINKGISTSCFLGVSDTIDTNSGCPSFLLHRNLKGYQNHVLVIKADRSLFKTDTCYELTVAGAKYDSLLFDIYVDVYSPNGIHKVYCGDIDIVNTERPQKVSCSSGKVKCIIQRLEDSKEVITLELTNAIFEYAKEKIIVSEALFKNVLISEWGG